MPTQDIAARSKEQLILESAQAYEERVVPIMFIPWGRRLLDSVPIARGHHVLDIACGSGAVSRLVAQRVGAEGSVTGVDLNPGMIATAKAVCASVDPPIGFHAGDATALTFEDDRFDIALCQQGVQFIPDKAGAIREMHRVLKTGGRLAFTQWRGLGHIPGYKALCDALEEHIGPEAADVMRTPFSAGDGDALHQTTEEAGFQHVERTIEIGNVRYPSAHAFTQWNIDAVPPGPKGHLKALFENVAGADRERLFEHVERSLAPYTDDKGVVFPMEADLVVAQK